jgi:hypothetical protein
MVKPEEGF